MFTVILLLQLLGTISCKKYDENVNSRINPECDVPERIETSPLSDCTSDDCYNFTIRYVIPQQTCPVGDLKCYYRFFHCRQNFTSAQDTCRCYNGSLSSFHTPYSNNQVSRYVQNHSHETFFAWIGVWKPRDSWKHKNVDGVCLSYTNWGPGQPDEQKGKCIALNVLNGKWYSASCCAQLPFLCTY